MFKINPFILTLFIILLSHHELGIPIVSPSSFGMFNQALNSTPSFHLTSFNTRNYQLSSVPPNMTHIINSPSRGVSMSGDLLTDEQGG